MNVYEFISSMFNGFITIFTAMIWPIAIIIVVVMLKTPITDLIKNIAKIKYKDLEFLISEKVDVLDENINNAVATSGQSVELKDLREEFSNYTIEQLNKELDKKILDLYSVSIDPRRDLSMNDPSHQLDPQNAPIYTTSYLLIKNIITAELSEAIRDWKELFNNIDIRKVDKNTREKYKENAAKIITVLDKKVKEFQAEASSS
ncbi:hypothetical protein [Bacillus xiamenensis]|uniref:hypothetical protein n=1 Tax=Bacillus xiamenensis TaxID=1178537 RepID=UPI00028C928D|nr:hypothetical protein [Bacillus xiamenensis]EKF33811.1 hypothetical protein BA1_18055 [Bacillus xiamenensis]